MKCEKYTKKDGTEGEVYTLELGDQVVFKKLFERDTKYGTQYSMSTEDCKYVKLTGGQAKAIKTQVALEGDKIVAEQYTNDFGTFIGAKVVHSDKTPSTQTQLPIKVTAEKFFEFVKEYKDSMGDKGNAMHMLGAYVANNCKEQFIDLIDLCKKEY